MLSILNAPCLPQAPPPTPYRKSEIKILFLSCRSFFIKPRRHSNSVLAPPIRRCAWAEGGAPIFHTLLLILFFLFLFSRFFTFCGEEILLCFKIFQNRGLFQGSPPLWLLCFKVLLVARPAISALSSPFVSSSVSLFSFSTSLHSAPRLLHFGPSLQKLLRNDFR